MQVTALAGPFAYFFAPPTVGGGTGGTVAKDALGNNIKVGKHFVGQIWNSGHAETWKLGEAIHVYCLEYHWSCKVEQ